MLFRMIREIKVSSDWFGYVHVISFHVARVNAYSRGKLRMYVKFTLKKTAEKHLENM